MIIEKHDLDAETLVNSLPGSHAVLDLSLTIVAASKSYTDLGGVTLHDIAGRNIFEVFPVNPESDRANARRNLASSLKKVLQTRDPDVMPVQRWDIRPGNRDGEFFIERYWKVMNAPIVSKSGTIIGLIHTVEEKTEEVLSLLESEERYQALVEASAQLVWTSDADGLRFDDSPSWRAFTGQAQDRWLGSGWPEAVHPEDRHRVVAEWDAIVKAGVPGNLEFRLYHAGSGEWRATAFRAVPLHRADGSIRGWIGVNDDIESEKRIKANLHRQMEFNRAITDNAPDALFPTDLSSRIEFANPAAERIFGYSRSELVGRLLHDVLHSHHDDGRVYFPEECPILAAIARHEPVNAREEVFFRKDGSRVNVACSVGLVRHSDGSAGAVYVVRDISVQKAAQEVQTTLAREVDHRAKNALAAVLAVVQMTRAERPADFVSAIQGRVATLSRVHSRLAEEGWTGLDLRSLLTEEMVPHLDPKNSKVFLAGPPITLSPDMGQAMGLLIHELHSNAVRYGALSVPGGSIDVTWKMDETGWVKIEWSETGGPLIRKRPVQQGFGTMMMDAAADQFGRGIEVSWLRTGLRCVISLAPDCFTVEASAGYSEPENETTDTVGDLWGRRILVAEDDSLLAIAICQILESYGCIVIGPARNIDEAFHLARTETDVDMAVLDVNLRGRQIWPVEDILSARKVPCLITTGYRDKVSPNGAPVLTKPFTADQLVAAMMDVLCVQSLHNFTESRLLRH
mgnify:CR=1 FL=1